MPDTEVEGNFPISDQQYLSDLAEDHNGVVLVFIPDTTGISSELQLKDLRNNSFKISQLGWIIIVVTSEPPEDFSGNSESLKLNFPIVHDRDNSIAKFYDTLGRTFDNPYISKRTKRRTYLLKNSLEILHVIDDIHPGYHTEDILYLLDPQLPLDHESNQVGIASGK